MRDGLIELLEKADRTIMGFTINGDLEILADHLLANGVIVPPCKVGDTVYIPNVIDKKVYKYRVNEINIGAGNNNVVVLDRYIRGQGGFILPRNVAIYFNQFGKTAFLSAEEAERLLWSGYER